MPWCQFRLWWGGGAHRSCQWAGRPRSNQAGDGGGEVLACRWGELSHQPAVLLPVGSGGAAAPREVPSILSRCRLCSHCVAHSPGPNPAWSWLCPVAAGSQEGGEVRSRGAGGALRQAWQLQHVSESCSRRHRPGNCLILPALPARDGISARRRTTVLWTSNYPGRGFARVPARAPALRWPLCPSPCGGARGGLQAAWIPAAGRGSCLRRLACGSAPQHESS